MTTAAISFSECQGAADRMFAYAILVSQAAKNYLKCAYNLHKVDGALKNLLSVATPERLAALDASQREHLSARLQEAHSVLAAFVMNEADHLSSFLLSDLIVSLKSGTEDLGDIIENLILMGDQEFLTLVGTCATSLGLDREENVAELHR